MLCKNLLLMACLNIFKKRLKEKSHFIFLSLLISAKIGNFRSSSTAKWICKRAWKGIYAHDLEKNKWFYRVNNTTSGNRMTFPYYYYRHFYFPKLIHHTQSRNKLTDYCCILFNCSVANLRLIDFRIWTWIWISRGLEMKYSES